MGLGGVLRVLTLSRGSWIEEGGEEWMRVLGQQEARTGQVQE